MQEEHVAKWATLLIERYLGEGWLTYIKFKEKNKGRFVFPMTKEKARTQLERITQWNHTINKFRTLILPVIVDVDIEDEMEII